jgi:hypothetical protein
MRLDRDCLNGRGGRAPCGRRRERRACEQDIAAVEFGVSVRFFTDIFTAHLVSPVLTTLLLWAGRRRRHRQDVAGRPVIAR